MGLVLAPGRPAAVGAPERVAVALGAALVALLLATLTALLVTSMTPDPAYEIRRELAPLDLVMSLFYGPAGALIVARSRHLVGWAFLAIGWGYGATAAGIAWIVLAVDHPGLPGQAWAPSVVVTGWTAATLISVLVLPWLLTPDRPTGWPRRAAVAGVAVVVVASAIRLLVQVDGAPPHPLTGGGTASDVAFAVDGWLIPCYFVLALAVAAHIALRLRRGGPDRRGLAWLLGSLVLVAVGYLAFEIGLSLEGQWYVVGTALIFVAEVMLPASVFVLIRRQDSWRLDLAVSRTLVGTLLTATLVVTYLLTVWALSMVTPWSQESAGLVAVAALALAVLPLLEWLQRQVERLVFGSGADPSALLERVAHALDASGTDTPQLAGLVASLRRALRLSYVEVGMHGVPLVSSGRRDPADEERAVRVPLTSNGQPVGTLSAVAPRGERLDPRSMRLLRQISGLVAVAAHLDETNRALEQARARLVDVRQEERRLLRRELHDGLGPALSGTALALAAVPHTSALSPEDAVLLRRLREELSRRADDVRQMARVLLPPVLDEGRLGDALTQLAERWSTPRFAVMVEATHADRLDGLHQVVVYQVAAEAVRNAARHAAARGCVVRVELPADGGVRLEVVDDGRGIDADAEPGIGITSMRERAAELGGGVTVSSGAVGTHVVMELP